MSETKVLTPNNVSTEANSTTNGEVQTGMLILVTPKAIATGQKNQYYSNCHKPFIYTVCACNECV